MNCCRCDVYAVGGLSESELLRVVTMMIHDLLVLESKSDRNECVDAELS